MTAGGAAIEIGVGTRANTMKSIGTKSIDGSRGENLRNALIVLLAVLCSVSSAQVLVTTAVVLLTFTTEVGAANVPHISGGVGADTREELLAKEKEYNLKIIAAEKSGDYLADVKVVIESVRKERVLDAIMEGPILLAKLAPGTYIIRATSAGQTLTQTVTIPAQGLRQVDFRWDSSK